MTNERYKAIQEGAKDFAERFEPVMKELAEDTPSQSTEESMEGVRKRFSEWWLSDLTPMEGRGRYFSDIEEYWITELSHARQDERRVIELGVRKLTTTKNAYKNGLVSKADVLSLLSNPTKE